MPKNMAVTHADLAPRRRNTDLGSKTGASLVVLTIFCGLVSFVLCLFAEATRSLASSVPRGGEGKVHECVYSGNGKVPLLSAFGAFLILTMTMVVEHTYILIGISKLLPQEGTGWKADFGTSQPRQAVFFFITTWICFTVAEILLLIGLSIESGHQRNWSRQRTDCQVIGQGLFCAAGILALVTILLSAGLYLTAVDLQTMFQEQDLMRRQMLDTSDMYASPPHSPPMRYISALAREGPVVRDGHQDSSPSTGSESIFAKFSNVV